MRRVASGIAYAVGTTLCCVAVLLPFRSNLPPFLAALLLVLPVVVGAIAGGPLAGLGGVACSFVSYIYFFVRPYETLVGSRQDWTALVTYLAVLVVITPLLLRERHQAQREAERAAIVERLLEVSERLVGSQDLEELLAVVASAVREAARCTTVAIFLYDESERRLAVSDGEPLQPSWVASVAANPDAELFDLAGHPVAKERLALVRPGARVGEVLLIGGTLDRQLEPMLQTFANQASAAISQAQLRDEAGRAIELEETDRWRRSLVGAVTHDLRSPLASIKAAATTLDDSADGLTPAVRHDLLRIVVDQTDQLDRLVTNLLDMAKIESGLLALQLEPVAVARLVEDAQRSLGPVLEEHPLVLDLDDGAHLVQCDAVLVTQVFTNLFANAARHAPAGSPIEVRTRVHGDAIDLFVVDHGEGVRSEDRERIFRLLDRRAGSSRAGVGLAICAAFVAAHGAVLSVRDTPGGGATFTFALAPARLEEVLR